VFLKEACNNTGKRLNGGDKIRESTLISLNGQFHGYRETISTPTKVEYELVAKKTIPLNKLRMVFLIHHS
jgi:hypothetical protein